MFVIAGVLAGGLAGAAVLSRVIQEETTYAGLALGMVSTSLMGAWVAYLGCGFSNIVRVAWRQAMTGADDRSDRRAQSDETLAVPRT